MKKRENIDYNRRGFVLSAAMTMGAVAYMPKVAFAGSKLFPVSISHHFGETTITELPKRIVTLGWGGEDALIALGAIPVGIPRYEQFDSGILPWIEERLGSEKPVLLSQGIIDFEAIAVLKPDIILAVRTNITSHDWKRLNSIAPTIAYRSGPLQADWQEITLLAGECLGQADQAKKLIAETKNHLHQLYKKNPVLDGQTFVFGSYFPGSNAIGVYFPDDLRVATLMELGLKVSPHIQAMAAQNNGQIGASISFEKLEDVKTDFLILWFPPGGKEELERQPLFQRFAPVQAGGFIAVNDPVSMWVTSNPSVLSIPYGYAAFIDRLVEAAEKSSATGIVP